MKLTGARVPALDGLRGTTLAHAFDPRNNAVGFLRLLFACAVVFSHAWPLGGFGTDPGVPGMNPGILAVDGFFVLSGVLITASAGRVGSVPRFLWHRALRILPAFWMALAIIGLVLAPLFGASLREGVDFIQANALLVIRQEAVGDTLGDTPLPYSWTGPMYTLAIEFACYLLVAVLLATRTLRTPAVALLAALAWVWTQVEMSTPGADYRQARFTFAFLCGSLLWLMSHRVTLRPRYMLAAGLVLAVVAVSHDYQLWVTFCIPAYAYLVTAAACWLPIRGAGTRADLSYGVYLYGWPVEQVLAAWGLNRLGVGVYLAAALVAAVALGLLSWRLVERFALRAKSWSPRLVQVDPVGREAGRVADV